MVTELKRKAEDDGASRHEQEKSVRELKEFLLQTLIGSTKLFRMRTCLLR